MGPDMNKESPSQLYTRREFLIGSAGLIGTGAAALACRGFHIPPLGERSENPFQRYLELARTPVQTVDKVVLGMIPDMDSAPQQTVRRIIALDKKLREWREAFPNTPLHAVSLFEDFYGNIPLQELLLLYIFQQGCLPMINLMPQNRDKPYDYYKFSEIGKDEECLKKLARFFRELEYPVLLRFAFEMNLRPSPINHYFPIYGLRKDNPPEDFVQAWCYTRSLFREEGAENVVWVFSPNIILPGEEELLARYAPPAEDVDVVGADIYDRHMESILHPNHYIFPDLSFKELFTPTFATLRRIYPQKPLWVTEIGSLRENEGDRALWLGGSLVAALNIFGVDGYFYFNYDKPRWPSDGDFQIDDKPEVARCLTPFFQRPEFINLAVFPDWEGKVDHLREKLEQQIGRSLGVIPGSS